MKIYIYTNTSTKIMNSYEYENFKQEETFHFHNLIN